jgi:hypothetical protein
MQGQILIVVLLVLFSIVPIAIAIVYPHNLNDDSFITLTFAKNLAAGKGFIYNQPPAVLGTTTPLFTLIVGGLGFVFGREVLVQIAIFITALCCLGIPWIFYIYRKAWQMADWQVLILCLVVNGSLWIGFLGMEAYLFSFLLVLAFSLFLNHDRGWCGFVVGLLFLTRGEGVLILAVTATTMFLESLSINEKKIDLASFFKGLLKLASGFLIPVLVWVVCAWLKFQAILPNTLRAKQAQGDNQFGVPFLYRLFTEWLPGWGRAFALGGKFSFINFWWLLVIAGLVYIVLKNRRWLMFLGWILLYISGYSLLNVSAYWWYQLPILFVMNLLFGLGLIFVIELIMNHISRHKIARLISVSLVLWVGVILGSSTFATINAYEGDPRGPYYIKLSAWFNENSDPSESIAFIEIGYLGFFTDNQIIDLAGLVTPDIVPYVSKGDFSWGFWHHEPDYYIHLPEFDWALGDIQQDPRFEINYELVYQTPGFTVSDFLVYKRR